HRHLAVSVGDGCEVAHGVRAVLDRGGDGAPRESSGVIRRVGDLVLEADVTRRRAAGDRDDERGVVGTRLDRESRGERGAVEPPNLHYTQGHIGERVRGLVVGEYINGRRFAATHDRRVWGWAHEGAS